MGAVHQFDPVNSGTHDAHDWWPAWYKRAFPDYVSHSIITDKRRQKQGIDHEVRLKGGGTALVDVKCRCTAKHYYSDILIEAWSDYERRIAGWARKSLHCHYIAYLWPQQNHGQHGLLIPFNLLRLAYEANKHEWAELGYFDKVNADNGTYTTKCFHIPVDRLITDIAKSMTVYFDDAQEPM